jgi:23S rRNA (guanine2445-N2)-methyltransferase / 23S rRNA (guanine2069-N7)-methyltransferase
MTLRRFFASTARGLADLLAGELRALGALDLREGRGGVSFSGTLEIAYRACLESRIASRVYLPLLTLEAPTTEQFYAQLLAHDWSAEIAHGTTLACEFSGQHPTIINTQFGALKMKDAVCDQLREATRWRPDIKPDEPGVRLHAHANGSRVEVSIDLSGEGLHRRGYRLLGGPAPLRENLAAGILLRAGWPQLARDAARFLDPMCGSGTLVIEAAMIAADLAPNTWRTYFGFLGWRGHQELLWQSVRAAARARGAAGVAGWAQRVAADPTQALCGSDRDGGMLRSARANAERAGVAELTRFTQGDLADAAPPAGAERGLVCANPPYGERLEDREAARATHRLLGEVLQQRFMGWQATVITAATEMGLELGLRAHRTHTLWNGAIECRLLRFDLTPKAVRDLRPQQRDESDNSLRESNGSRMFGNRIAKNLKRLRAWVRREAVSCYRIYDADMPEYAFAIDRYEASDGSRQWLYVQEYAAPEEIPQEQVKRRRAEALAALPEAMSVARADIHLRTRKRMSGSQQYEKQAERREFFVVAESSLKFEVNFEDYLDTGLFLDHRSTRQRLRDQSANKKFLNLFAYTGSATVYAAAGGARDTLTVDLSYTYLDWARRNLRLNGFEDARHELVQADAREWLKTAKPGFDLIFLDPPTFSNSARMQGVLDVQRDHVELIDACMSLLSKNGLLVFSTNAQKFKLDDALANRYGIEDISRKTLSPDFERNPKIHRCFELRLRN